MLRVKETEFQAQANLEGQGVDLLWVTTVRDEHDELLSSDWGCFNSVPFEFTGNETAEEIEKAVAVSVAPFGFVSVGGDISEGHEAGPVYRLEVTEQANVASLLQYFAEYPEATNKEAAGWLGLSRGTVRNKLQGLADVGVVKLSYHSPRFDKGVTRGRKVELGR